MDQFRFTTLSQTSFQSAYTTVRSIIIGINYKSLCIILLSHISSAHLGQNTLMRVVGLFYYMGVLLHAYDTCFSFAKKRIFSTTIL
jgi:hypothetical protein